MINNPSLIIYDLFANSDYCYSKLTRLKILVWFVGFLWVFWKIKFFFSCSHKAASSLLRWHYEQMSKSIFKKIKGVYLKIIGASFMLILGRNLWGLFPYIFGVTTQMVLTFRAAWVFWLTYIFSRMEFSPIKFFSNFIPSGSPVVLAPFLALVELVRNLIRPITLSLRLSIKITTGHVFIALMSVSRNVCLFSSTFFTTLISLLMVGYLLFECGICFIQGYVFSLLNVQYASEHV